VPDLGNVIASAVGTAGLIAIGGFSTFRTIPEISMPSHFRIGSFVVAVNFCAWQA
jgi:hypothetical protein